MNMNKAIIFFQQFDKLKFPYLTVELEGRDDCNQIQAVLGELTGATTVSIENSFFTNKRASFTFSID